MSDVTQLLGRWRAGDREAFEELFGVLYAELRRLAQGRLNAERPGHTLQGTALVHEVYLRLAQQRGARLENRSHFLAVAAQAMRRVLVDHSRRRSAAKRDGGQMVSLDDDLLVGDDTHDFQSLDLALDRLAQRDARRAHVVELRFFGGMTESEISTHLGVSPVTVRRDWTVARAWLYRELRATPDGERPAPEEPPR